MRSRGASDRRHIRSLAARFLLLACALSLTLAALEIALRAVGARPKSATVLSTYFRHDDRTGWIGQPGAACWFVTTDFDVFVSHDGDGFRKCGAKSSVRDDAKRAGEVVWCLGDSGTWGWGVDDGKTYVDRLNGQGGHGVVYRNLGVCGYSSVQQYLLLKKFFEQGIRPTQVVILYCGNDLYENMDDRDQDPPRPYLVKAASSVAPTTDERADTSGRWELRNDPVPPARGWRVRSWLKRNLLVYNYAHFYVRSAKATLKAWRATHDAPTPSGAKSEVVASSEPTPTQQALREIYRRIKDLCARHEVRLAIVAEGGDEIGICRDLGIPCANLSERWRRHFATPGAPSISFRSDPHFNELGHKLIAEVIQRELPALRTAWDASVPPRMMQ